MIMPDTEYHISYTDEIRNQRIELYDIIKMRDSLLDSYSPEMNIVEQQTLLENLIVLHRRQKEILGL